MYQAKHLWLTNFEVRLQLILQGADLFLLAFLVHYSEREFNNREEKYY